MKPPPGGVFSFSFDDHPLFFNGSGLSQAKETPLPLPFFLFRTFLAAPGPRIRHPDCLRPYPCDLFFSAAPNPQTHFLPKRAFFFFAGVGGRSSRGEPVFFFPPLRGGDRAAEGRCLSRSFWGASPATPCLLILRPDCSPSWGGCSASSLRSWWSFFFSRACCRPPFFLFTNAVNGNPLLFRG